MLVIIATIVLLVAHQGQCLMKATATLYPNALRTPMGSLAFTQENAESPVHIVGTTSGLQANSAHGFHIHVNPVAASGPDCMAAGPHFNPYDKVHGPPTADIDHRHVGDLGNITADDDGTTIIDMFDSIIQLYNATQSIIDRTVVIHQYRDDGGQGGFNDSDTTGNTGQRILCGLIILSGGTTSTQPVTHTTEHSTSPSATTEHSTSPSATTEHSTSSSSPSTSSTTAKPTSTSITTAEPVTHTTEHSTSSSSTTAKPTPPTITTAEPTTAPVTTEAPMTTVTIGNTTMSFSTRINVQPVMLVFTTVTMITYAIRA